LADFDRTPEPFFTTLGGFFPRLKIARTSMLPDSLEITSMQIHNISAMSLEISGSGIVIPRNNKDLLEF
jgi:hypothetical protein